MKCKAGGVVTLVTALFIGIAGPAAHATTDAAKSATPSAKAAPDPGLVWQASVTTLTNQLWDLGDQDAKFSMIGIDTASQTVTVYRKGGAPANQYADAAARAHQKLVFKNAQLTQREANAVMDELDREHGKWSRAGLDITSTTYDGAGPVVVHARATNTVAPTATALTTQFDALEAGIVSVASDGTPAETLSSPRLNDAPPFAGGSWIHSAEVSPGKVEACTSGFTGVSTKNHHNYMVTAYHCVKPKDRRMWTMGGRYIGTASALDPGHDLAVIPTSTVNLIYDGAADNSSVGVVTQMVHPSVGLHICNDGVYSLSLCNGVAQGTTHVTLTSDFGVKYTAYEWYANSSDNQQLVAEGDSGGPDVAAGTANNALKAIGINSAGANKVTCNSLNSAITTKDTCFKTLFFTSVYDEVYKKHTIDVTKS
jgi:hypothetical protein